MPYSCAFRNRSAAVNDGHGGGIGGAGCCGSGNGGGWRDEGGGGGWRDGGGLGSRAGSPPFVCRALKMELDVPVAVPPPDMSIFGIRSVHYVYVYRYASAGFLRVFSFIWHLVGVERGGERDGWGGVGTLVNVMEAMGVAAISSSLLNDWLGCRKARSTIK